MKKYLCVILAYWLIATFCNGKVAANPDGITLKSGKMAYGFCYQDGSWGATPQYGLYSFNMSLPSTINKEWSSNLNIDAGAYYDGYYYVQTSTSSFGSYTSMKFGKFNASTGEYSQIADWTSLLPRFRDMTIDYSTTPPTIMGFQYISATSWRLVKIDMNTGAIANVSSSNSSGQFVAIACKLDGTVYSMNLQGRLQTINKQTGAVTNVSSVANDFMPYNIQTMDFDHTDETLYWAMNNQSDEGKFGSVNLTTGLLENANTIGANAQFAALYIPFRLGEIGSPTSVSEFTVKAGDNGTKTAILSWKNPLKDNVGENLSNITAIKIYRNDQLLETIVNPAVGAIGNYLDNLTTAGVYIYKITAENNHGIGALAEYIRIFIGEDMPAGPTNVVLSKDDNNAIITWTSPSVGVNNGWIDLDALKYKIIRNPGAVVVADNIVGNSYTDETIPNLNNYYYTVYSKTNAGLGGMAISNSLYIGNPFVLPYTSTFTVDQFNLWKVLDVNADNKTWIRQTSGGVKCEYHAQNSANDWLISPSVFMSTGKYKLAFDYRASSASYPEKMKVFYGNGTSVENQTIQLKEYSEIKNSSYLRDEIVFNITSDGTYNFSFYACSEKDRSGLFVHNVFLESMVENDLMAMSIAGENLLQTGKEYTHSIGVKNNGWIAQTSYKVQLIDEQNLVLGETAVNESIAVNDIKVISVKWTPTIAGNIKLRARVLLDEDQKDENDISAIFNVNILSSSDGDLTIIGTETAQGVTMPINFSFKSGVAQTIYLKADINSDAGVVRRVIYPYQNDNINVLDKVKPVRIYIANTTLSNMSSGWIPENQFTLVYDGNINLLGGANNIDILLTDPFVYAGDNICVMCVRPLDDESFTNFKFRLVDTSDDRTRTYVNSSIEFDYTQAGTLQKRYPKTAFQIDSSSEIGRPTKVTDLSVVSGENGAKVATLEWINPTKDNVGVSLSKIDFIRIYRNEEIIATIENPSVGDNGTYIDNTIANNGVYTYKVVAENNGLVGASANASLFIGEDTLLPPTDLILTQNGGNAVLTWNAPTTGIHNGWVDVNGITYKIFRNPGNVLVNDNVTVTTYTDNSITELGNYYYSIQAVTSAGMSATVTSATMILGPALPLPYICDFSTNDLFDLWTIIDANQDSKTWELNLSSKVAQYPFSPINDGDDWLISPPIHMPIGRYKLSFSYKSATSGSSGTEKMKVLFGNAADITHQSTMLKDYSKITNTDFINDAVDINVTTEGSYNFSFYAYSTKAIHTLSVDNVVFEKLMENDLEAIAVTGTALPIENVDYEYIVKIKNRGYLTQASYEVQLIDENGHILASKIVNNQIEFEQVKDITINWTPTSVGVIKIRGKVILLDDEVNDNNTSGMLNVDVQPSINKMIVIGDGTETLKTMPFNFYFKSSLVQTIYLKSEIGVQGGLMNKVIYHYENGNDANVIKPVKLYMTNTSVSVTSADWLPDNIFTKVFDGLITIAPGKGELIISLDTPFVYTGENICIMSVRPMDTQIKNNINYYVTTKNTNRSRIYNHDYIEFNGEQSGIISTNIANITMQIDVSEGGEITGIVTNNGTPISGAKVVIGQYNIIVTTDSSGRYTFNYIPVGNYELTVSKHGYETKIEDGISVIAGQTVTRNINIITLPKYAVSGVVKNIDGTGVQNATISISGYSNYSVKTDASGNFSIPNVYKADAYKLEVNKKLMLPYSSTFDVVDSDVIIPTIILTDVPNIPLMVNASLSEEKLKITWEEPSDLTTFRYDNGTIIGGLGIENGTDKTVFGSVHHSASVLTSMSWHTLSSSGGPHNNVNVFVLDLNASGFPTSKVIFNQNNVANNDNQWTTFTFPTPIECPNGFMIAISYNGFVGLGHDSGIDLEYPFANNAHFYSGDYTTGTFYALSGFNSFNFAIRAEGFELSRYMNTESYNDNQLLTENVFIKDIPCSPIVTSEIKQGQKSLNGYKVWRFLATEELNSENWTLLTPIAIKERAFIDEDWRTLNPETYKYAVKAIYSNDILSDAGFSNNIAKVMTYSIMASAGENGTISPSGNVTANSGSNMTFTMKPNENYIVADVIVDGISVGNVKKYTFTNISEDHTISVLFQYYNSVKFEEQISINMYPNPVKDVLHIEGDYQSLEIYNAVGQLMITANGEDVIDVSQLKSGTYSIKVKNKNIFTTYKIVK